MSNAAATTVPVRSVSLTRKQILSLFGLVPLGVYVVLHLWTNMYSVGGPQAFDAAIERSRNPAYTFLEIFGLGLPILVHTIVGTLEVFRGRPNNLRYAFFNNLKFLLQRLTAIGVGLFIVAHVINARILPMFKQSGFDASGHETFAGMHEALSEPLTLAVYVLAMVGIAYHLANGVYTAGTRWGLAISPAGRRRMQVISAVVFVVLAGMAGTALAGFFMAPAA